MVMSLLIPFSIYCVSGLYPFNFGFVFQAHKRVVCNRVRTSFFFLSAVQWRCRATCLTCSRLSRPPCSQAQRGFRWQRRGQVKSCRFQPTSVFLDFGDLFCMLAFSCCCLTLTPTSSSPPFFCLFLLLCLSFLLSAQILSPLLKLEMIPCQTLTLSSQNSLSMPLTYLSCLQTVLAFPLGHLVMKCLVVTTHFCFSSKVLSLLFICL